MNTAAFASLTNGDQTSCRDFGRAEDLPVNFVNGHVGLLMRQDAIWILHKMAASACPQLAEQIRGRRSKMLQSTLTAFVLLMAQFHSCCRSFVRILKLSQHPAGPTVCVHCTVQVDQLACIAGKQLVWTFTLLNPCLS